MKISSSTTRAEIDAICEKHERYLDQMYEYQENERQRKKDRLDNYQYNDIEARSFMTSRRKAHD